MIGKRLAFNSDERHQRKDAALAVVADAHGHANIFYRHHYGECPKDQGHDAEQDLGSGSAPGEVDDSLQRVKWACTYVPKDDAERREPQRGKADFVRIAVMVAIPPSKRGGGGIFLPGTLVSAPPH